MKKLPTTRNFRNKSGTSKGSLVLKLTTVLIMLVVFNATPKALHDTKHNNRTENAILNNVDNDKMAILPVQNENIVSQQESFTVSGKVTDNSGAPLPGVNIYEKTNPTNGITTDFDGNYTINVSSKDVILVFSFIGFITQEINVDGKEKIDVVLIENSISLNEVVAIGYGTQKKSNITGSVGVVDMEELPSKSPTNTAEMLQGTVAGVQVSTSGDPGKEPVIRIRGLNSFGNNNPLYIVDGNPTADTRDLNPKDIESIQILKDASAAAIYGSRAANGVILVTTKKGKGDMSVNFDARVGVDQSPKFIDLANSVEFAKIDNMAHDNAGLAHVPSSDMVLADPNSLPDTDWQRYLIRPGVLQDYNLSLSKGNDKSTYRFALSYFDKEGITIGSEFERINATFSSTHKYKKFDFGFNVRLAYSNGSDVIGLPFMDVLQALPNVAIYDSRNVGGYGTGDDMNPTYFTNPVGLQETNINNAYTYKALSNIYLEYEIFDFLKYKFNTGIDFSYQNFIARREEAYLRYLDNPISSLTDNNNKWINYTFTNTLTFDKMFGEHSVNAVFGFAFEDNYHRSSDGYGENISQDGNGDYFWVLNAARENQKVYGAEDETGLYSEFLRINYEYKNKYLVQVSGRADHSSRFSKTHRTAFFPAASIGWKINEEGFMKDVDLISLLKFRASFGQLGGQELGAYDYQAYVNPNVNYVLGTNQSVLNGATQIKIANEDIKWQTTTTYNVGFDFALKNNQITGSAEYYVSNTDDAILPVDLPPSTGNFEGNPYQNIGTLKNSGFEFALGYREMGTALKYSFNFTLGTLKNEVEDLGDLGQISSNRTMTRPGYAIGTFFLRQTDGIFQIGEEEEAAKQGAYPGDIRFIDANSDGVINDDDRVMMGDPFPKVDLGLGAKFEYKGFDLSLFLFSQLGHEIFNGPLWQNDRSDDRFNKRAGYSPWTVDNPSNTTPIAIMGAEGSRNFYIDQDRYLEKGDYLKLKNLEIGYTLPLSILGKIGVDRLRIYFSGQNLFTISGYSGYDPEIVNPNILERGVDWGAFPNPRTISGGIHLKF